MQTFRAIGGSAARRHGDGPELDWLGKLHRQTARAPLQLLRHLNNDGLPRVHLPERQLVIEVECDEQLIASPSGSKWHEVGQGALGYADSSPTHWVCKVSHKERTSSRFSAFTSISHRSCGSGSTLNHWLACTNALEIRIACDSPRRMKREVRIPDERVMV